MSDDRLKDEMRNGSEAVVVPPLDLPAITGRGRKLRMRRTALVAAASTLMVAISIPLAIALTRSETRSNDLQPAEALPAGGPVTDGEVTFEVVTVQCSENSFEVEGPYCFADVRVSSESAELISLQDEWQALHFGGQRIAADNEAFAEYFDDYFTPNHAFGAPLEPKVPSGSLFFQGVPAAVCPDAIELHSSEDSVGVVLQIDDCLIDEGQGTGDQASGPIVFSGLSADGEEVTATIELKDGKVCFDIPDALAYRAAHLHLVDANSFRSPVLASFFEPPDAPSARGCVEVAKFDEEALASGSANQFVDLHISKVERVVLERSTSGSTSSNDGSTHNFNAVWPEDTYEQAGEACGVSDGSESPPESFRRNPRTTAATFALEVLGWDGEVRVSERSDRSSDVTFEVRRDAEDAGRTAKGPAALVYVTEAFSDCWSVAHVSPVTEGDPQETGSMSVRGRDVFMRFDKRGANSVTHEVGYGGEVTRYEWTEGDPQNVEFKLEFDPKGTGHFLLLYRDVYGGVIGAQGSGLPEGDFAAG